MRTKYRTMSKLNSISEEGRMRLRDERERYAMIEKQLIIESFKFPNVPSKDGYYHMMVPDHRVRSGRKHYKAKTIEELQEKIYRHEKGISGYASKSFYDVFVITQEEHLKYVKSEEKRLSVMNTVGRHWQDYNRYFGGTDFEKKIIGDITKLDIENIILSNLCKYQLRKRAFINMTAILNTVFKLAYQQEWIERNPYDFVNIKDSRFMNMIVEPIDIENRIYTDIEIRKIKDEISQKHSVHPDYMPAYALELQMLLGLRRAEVCAIKFSDIEEDPKTGVLCLTICRELLSVKKSEVNTAEFSRIVEHTKTNKNRKIPIFEELRKLILTISKVHRECGWETPYLFPAENENGCISINSVYNYYRRICHRTGIPIQADIIRGPHAFRRNAAERLSNAGGNAEMVAKLLGNTPTVLKNNYYDGLNIVAAQELLNSTDSVYSLPKHPNEDVKQNQILQA